MTRESIPPGTHDVEVSVFGPGYGESIAIHAGGGQWILVDSCVDENNEPHVLQYLRGLGADPSKDVRLILATHWHDDHIRGMSKLVDACPSADFACSSALSEKEFLSVVGANRTSSFIDTQSSGVDEIHRVFTLLRGEPERLSFAIANKRLLFNSGCEVWALSPSDADFRKFLVALGALLPQRGETKKRVPTISPNSVSVVLWIKIGVAVILLGADLEKRGWKAVLASSARPDGKSTLFKVPHHGSANAHEARVWRDMLETNVHAVLTPWQLCGRELPSTNDVDRILSRTKYAYSSAGSKSLSRAPKRRDQAVSRTIKESSITLRRTSLSKGMARFRRTGAACGDWNVELFGRACHLKEFFQ